MPIVTRRAVFADMPELLRLGRLFHQSNHMAAACEFIEDNALQSLEWLLSEMAAGRALLAVSDHVPDVIDAHTTAGKLGGMLAVLAVPSYFNRGFVMVQELFWYSENGHGMELVTAAKRWQAEIGSRAMLLAETGRSDPRLQRVYERMGFLPVERFYLALDKGT